MLKDAVKDEAGFSLAEIAIVIFLVGALLLISLSSLRGYQSSINLKALARGFAGDLRLTQQYAVTNDQDYKLVVITAGTPLYRIQRVSDGALAKEVDLPADVTVTTTFVSNAVSFASTGVPSAAGGISVTDTSGNTLTACVRATTGRVQIVEGGTCP